MIGNKPYPDLHRELIFKCKRGDRNAQFEIYRLYYKAMFNTSYRIVNNFQDAEDIMQDAFLKAFRNLGSYKGEVSFGSWLRKIVVNQSLDYLRKRKVQFTDLNPITDIQVDDNGFGNEDIDVKTEYKMVLNEIMKLPEGYRVILSLYLLEGYDHEEIAQILEISASTSRSQFNRAKKRLIDNIKNRNKNE
jgi:RNA polymerase sigma factor (sigma-70 family)